jgi:hypothetical protein
MVEMGVGKWSRGESKQIHPVSHSIHAITIAAVFVLGELNWIKKLVKV